MMKKYSELPKSEKVGTVAVLVIYVVYLLTLFDITVNDGSTCIKIFEKTKCFMKNLITKIKKGLA